LIKEQLHLSIPRSGSFLVSQLRVIFFTAFATTLGPGILSIYVFAQRIIDASIQVIPQSISTASLPTLSSQYALNDFIAYKSTFKRNILSIFLVSLVLTLVFIFASNLVVYILYGNISHNNEIATMLRWFAIGLPIYAINTYISIALSSLRDTKSLLYANGIATIIAVLLFFVLKNYNFGVYSLIFSSLIVTPVFLITILLLYRGKKDIFV
jgi:putative peptidoglycan lipid II flippase